MTTAGNIDRNTGASNSFDGVGVTDGAGNVTFNFVPPFASVPVVQTAIQSASTNTVEARITALTAAACTINVRGSAVLVILGLNVLGAPIAQSGATVHLHAQHAGRIIP